MDLIDFERRWNEKPLLRKVYSDFFRRALSEFVEGPSLEIGGGLGKFHEFAPEVLVSDIQFSSYMTLCADAHNIPFRKGSLGNIVGFDVLHHFQYPFEFLKEAARVLRPGGRLVLIEPAITAGSYLFYKFLHHEPVKFVSLESMKHACSSSDPYDSNQAIPTILSRNTSSSILQHYGLKVVKREKFGVFVYPLSGGFKPWSLLPYNMADMLTTADNILSQYVGNLFGFRITLVFERQSP